MHQIRRFDDLGRIAIPKEIREAATHVKNTEGVQMEVYMDDGSIVLKPHKPKDMVEVVRCKDCRHKDFRYYDKESVFCYMSAKHRHINDFCSYGAKMDGGDRGE